MYIARTIDRRLQIAAATLLALAVALGCAGQARAGAAGTATLALSTGGSVLAGLLYHVQQPMAHDHAGYYHTGNHYARLPAQRAPAAIVIGSGPAMIYHSVAPSGWVAPSVDHSSGVRTVYTPEALSVVSPRP
ncbi:MAG: hypothetical protein HQL60_08410 [Magnetococcales bacterium]|nr:hypothetical protein [Magnetococcales bacterium]